MCSIYGWYGTVPKAAKIHLLKTANQRGRDGYGIETEFLIHRDVKQLPDHEIEIMSDLEYLMGNHRATPTNELESREELMQPYDGFFHNGTISNDIKLAEEWKHKIDESKWIDSMILPKVIEKTSSLEYLNEQVKFLEGSYALGFRFKHSLYGPIVMLACNYKPIYYLKYDFGFMFASTPEMLLGNALKMPPYSALRYSSDNHAVKIESQVLPVNKKVALSASAGLDSTTAAYMLKEQGYEVVLVHFTYGCNAEKRELKNVKAIAADGGFILQVIDIPRGVMSGTITKGDYHKDGIGGTEYAFDWVSARNLVMLSLLTAFAESSGISNIAFGGNLEEGGSYPDNEHEFGRMFNNILPYATQNGVKIQLLQPLSHLMKHEIVKEGLRLGVPYNKTWSCYSDKTEPCCQCGPCFMRTTAFERNGSRDPLLPKQVLK